MIPKSELLHGVYYAGKCRNASIARWNATSNQFTYWRHKFGSDFLESIRHPEDDNGFDLFVPTHPCEPTNPPIEFKEL